MSAPASLSQAERDRRHSIVKRFIATAIDGNVASFAHTIMDVDWPGAWLEIFKVLAFAPRNLIDDDIRYTFLAAWRGDLDLHDVDPRNASAGLDWTLTKDLDSDQKLMVRCLKILMPSVDVSDSPQVLYRGQSLAGHEAGAHGIWWSAHPLYAELFARGKLRDHNGQGAVLVAVNPADAIIYKLNRMEFLLDPSKLDDVRLLDVPPRETAAEAAMSQLERDTHARLLGVPTAYQSAQVREWLALGMPLAGLKKCRDERVASIMRELAEGGKSIAA